MTAEKKCPSSFFKVALAAAIDGVKQLNSIGVPNNEAAALVGRLWTDACNESSASHYSSSPPASPAPGGFGPSPASDKAAVIQAFKSDVARLGITEDDMAKHFGDFERHGPTSGAGAEGTTPTVDQTHETGTTPAGGPPTEAPTGEPPHGEKPAKPAKPKAG